MMIHHLIMMYHFHQKVYIYIYILYIHPCTYIHAQIEHYVAGYGDNYGNGNGYGNNKDNIKIQFETENAFIYNCFSV